MSPNQKARLEQDFSSVAGEPVTSDQIGGRFYIFGSELAILRIFHKRSTMKAARAEYSLNLKTWVFGFDGFEV